MDFEISDDLFEAYVTEQESEVSSPLITTVAYQFGHGTEDSANSSRRLDLRLQWEQLLDNGMFVRLDNKFILRHSVDQQLEADETVALDNRLRELYMQKNVDDVTLSIGQQIVVWGEMDSLSVTDIFAPWDYSEFVFTAPEDARIGQPIIQSQWYRNNSSLQLIYVPWPQVNEYPTGNGNEVLATLLGNTSFTINEHLPDAFEEDEVGLNWQQSTDAYDVSLMLARVRSNDPVFSTSNNINFDSRYPAYRMAGVSANYATDTVLWKGEFSYYDDLFLADSATANSRQLAVGFDYEANGAYNLSVEHAHQQVRGDLPAVQKVHTSQSALRWSKNFLHETLVATYFFSYQWQYHDRVHSANLDYDINDTWNVQTNITVFEGGGGASLGQITEKWDQVAVRVTASF